jgi:UDP-2-acetamido-3-amino-2,3-dideoxy-glucuronate N-acetyltransferase
MSTIVEKGATMGANCTIVCGNNIGEYSFVAAGAVVTSSTKTFSLNMGVPARQVGWVSKNGDIIDLPLEGNGEYFCKKDNVTYKLINNNLVVDL